MDIVELLLYKNKAGWYYNPDGPEAAEEIKRLRQQVAYLLTEMERVADVSERWEDSLVSQINEIARAAIAKAKGGE